jgi:uncharacterized RDD family membrane protein YckC
VIDRYLRRGADKRAREILTPEGVSLSFTLASASERAGAFLLDIVFMFCALIVVAIVIGIMGGGPWSNALLIIAAFVIRQFYFVIFEGRWQGVTPGKRITGIRVMDARGRQLDASAILARNLVREIETWQPLTFLVTGNALWPNAPWWAKLASGVWLFLFMFMPLFNRDRLRIGDLIGGTRVVIQPRTLLVPDLADKTFGMPQLPWGPKPQEAPTFPFTAEQLDVYGIYELQVLEGVLRGDVTGAVHGEALSAVAAKIHAKIRYHVPVLGHQYERFLRDFYTALRSHLEKEILFGQRKEDKFAK